MLRYNFEPIFRLRKIERPFTFLKKIGIGDYKARQISQGKLDNISTRDLEKLCLFLNCTVHDVMEWEPDGNLENPEKRALSVLRRRQKDVDWEEAIKSVPVEIAGEVVDMIRGKVDEAVKRRPGGTGGND